MGLKRGFYGFGLWKKKFRNIPLIFAGFVLLGRCLPTKYRTIYHGFKRIKEEQRLLIQQKKIMDAAGISSIQVETFWILLLNTALKKVGIVVLVEGSLPTEEMSRVRI